MIELLKIFIPVVAGLTIPMIIYYRQQWFVYKNRIKVISDLLDDSINHCNTYSLTLENHIIKVRKDYIKRVERVKYPFPAIETISDRIISDDYHTAYRWIMEKSIDGPKYYRRMKHSAFRAKHVVEEIDNIIKTQDEEDAKRRKEFRTKLKEWNNSFKSLIYEDHDEQTIASLISLHENFKNNRRSNNNISEVHQLLLIPVAKFLETKDGQQYLYVLRNITEEMLSDYINIGFQTKFYCENLMTYIPELKKERDSLIEVRDFLNNSQIRSLYM